MTIDEMIAVLQAAKDGKQIQFKDGAGWDECFGDPTWNFQRETYRVKPEPREWWIVVGNRFIQEAYPCVQVGQCMEQVHVREVLE